MTDETSRPQRPGESPYPPSAWGPPPGASAPAPSSAPPTTWPGYENSQFGGLPVGPPPPPTAGGPPQPDDPGRRRGSPFLGIAVLALVMTLVAGGLGGVVGYQLARGGSSLTNALDQPPPGARPAVNLPTGSAEQVSQKVTPAVVKLEVSNPQLSGEGSGIVLSSDGLILTNNHVIDAAVNGGEAVAVFQDGTRSPVQIVGRAPSFDLAVVRAQGVSGLATAELGRSDDVLVGQPVLAIGSPLGLSGTVTSGIVSALDRPVLAGGEGSGQDTVLDALQTDAAINPGNSGGPLVDMAGRVIGINSAIASLGANGQAAGSIGLGFAIPIDQAKRIADELITTGQATQAVLGVRVAAGQAAEDGGATVREVMPDSVAARAGIQPGEIITKVDDRLIEDGNALVAAIRSYPPGAQVTLVVRDRAGATRQVAVTLGSQPVESS